MDEHFHAHQDVAYPIKGLIITHHFHTWMVPRYEWMNQFGRSVESVRPVLLHARNEMNNEENIHEVMKAIKLLTDDLR